MFTIFTDLSSRDIPIIITPALIVALFIAEQWYKFGSFSIECLVFLATWYILIGAFNKTKKHLQRIHRNNSNRTSGSK